MNNITNKEEKQCQNGSCGKCHPENRESGECYLHLETPTMNNITKTIKERAEFYEKAIAPLTNSTADIPAHISHSHKAVLESVRDELKKAMPSHDAVQEVLQELDQALSEVK